MLMRRRHDTLAPTHIPPSPLHTRLETYTFPCEAKFAELDFAREVYSKSVRRHLMNGTTTCSYFATLHLEASKVGRVVLACLTADRRGWW